MLDSGHSPVLRAYRGRQRPDEGRAPGLRSGPVSLAGQVWRVHKRHNAQHMHRNTASLLEKGLHMSLLTTTTKRLTIRGGRQHKQFVTAEAMTSNGHRRTGQDRHCRRTGWKWVQQKKWPVVMVLMDGTRRTDCARIYAHYAQSINARTRLPDQPQKHAWRSRATRRGVFVSHLLMLPTLPARQALEKPASARPKQRDYLLPHLAGARR